MTDLKPKTTPRWLKTEMEILSMKFFATLIAMGIFLLLGAAWLIVH